MSEYLQSIHIYFSTAADLVSATARLLKNSALLKREMPLFSVFLRKLDKESYLAL